MFRKKAKPTDSEKLLELVRDGAVRTQEERTAQEGAAPAVEAKRVEAAVPDNAPATAAGVAERASGAAKTRSGGWSLKALGGGKRAIAGKTGAKAGAEGSPGRLSFARGLGGNGKVGVGVVIAPGKAVMVKARNVGEGFEILGVKTTHFDAAVPAWSDEAAVRVRAALGQFLGAGAKVRVWTSMPTSGADVGLVSFPKVPKKQVDNAAFWSAKREFGFEEDQVVFDYEARSDVVQKGVQKMSVLGYYAPRQGVADHKAFFEKAGRPLTGLTMPAFASQNLFRRKAAELPPGGAALLYVGWEWSRLEIHAAEGVVFTRVIKACLAGMEQCLLDEIESREMDRSGRAATQAVPELTVSSFSSSAPETEIVLELDDFQVDRQPAVLTLELDEIGPGLAAEPEPAGREATPDAKAKDSARPETTSAAADSQNPSETDAAKDDAPEGASETVRGMMHCLMIDDDDAEASVGGFTCGDIFEMTLPAVNRLSRQVEMTLKHYRETLGKTAVGKVFVSGPLAASGRFQRLLTDNLGLPCEPFDPLGAAGDRRSRAAIGELSLHGRSQYDLALGLALSEPASTPNLLFTYKEKREAANVSNFNRYALLGCAFVMAGLGGLNLWQGRLLDGTQRRHDVVKNQLDAFKPRLSLELLQAADKRAGDVAGAVKAFARRNQALAAAGEALSLAPENVRVISLSADLGPLEASDKDEKKAPLKERKTAGAVTVDGLVAGDKERFDAALSSYLVALRGSPLFVELTVVKNQPEVLAGTGEQAQRFVLTLSLAGL